MNVNNLFDLKGKVAIVTGGGNGIGKASCLMLAKSGTAVAVSDLKHEDALKVAEEIKAFGGKSIGVSCNVTKDEELVNLVETKVKELGGAHILVNNAGDGRRENPFKISVDNFAWRFQLGIFSAWRLSQLCVPYMEKDDYSSKIRVNAVEPDATKTAALASVLTPEIESKMLAHTPIKRLCEVDDIAGAVLYFAAPISKWASGQVIFVNGGGVQTLY